MTEKKEQEWGNGKSIDNWDKFAFWSFGIFLIASIQMIEGLPSTPLYPESILGYSFLIFKLICLLLVLMAFLYLMFVYPFRLLTKFSGGKYDNK